ncbi:hypothetical protein [Inhella sp.]|uniref:hypothetical protein n=1 Tax=Inhella sp. TaxID=1921806 RepID=UPI0035AE6224
MEVVLFFLFMLSFWLFVRWDQRRLQRVQPLSRETMKAGVQPSTRLSPWHWGLASAAATSMALVAFLHPARPPFSGRWSFFKGLLYALLGTHWWAWLCVMAAAVCAALMLHGVASRARAQRR